MAPERKGSLKTSSDVFQGLYKGADILLLRYLFPKPEDISLEALIPMKERDSIPRPSSIAELESSTDAKASASRRTPVPMFNSIFSALLYCFVGLAMGFMNKAVLMQWPYSNSLLMLQMAASVVIVYSLGCVGLIEVKPFDWNSARSLSGVVFFYNANVAFALAAVEALSIPVYHVLKRLTPVMVLCAKYLIGDGSPPLEVCMSVLAVVSGCFLAGAGDLSFDARGYLWAIVSCMLQTAYLILVERSGSQKGFTTNDLLVYNGVMSFPVLAGLTLITGEAQRSIPRLFELSYGPDSLGFAILFVVSLGVGVLLNYSLFFCTISNSALTTTIVGTLRSVLGTTIGFFVLGGVKATPLIVAGSSVNTVGGVWYTYAKYKAKNAQQAERAEQVKAHSSPRMSEDQV
ncbi:unnamed protein product [Closterium sp. NIES-53]